MRAYIYQARDLLAGDETGLSGEFNYCTYSGVLLHWCNKNKLTRTTLFLWRSVQLYDYYFLWSFKYELVLSYALFHWTSYLEFKCKMSCSITAWFDFHPALLCLWCAQFVLWCDVQCKLPCDVMYNVSCPVMWCTMQVALWWDVQCKLPCDGMYNVSCPVM